MISVKFQVLFLSAMVMMVTGHESLNPQFDPSIVGKDILSYTGNENSPNDENIGSEGIHYKGLSVGAIAALMG